MVQTLFVSEKHNERSKHRFPSTSFSKVEKLQEFVRLKALPVVGEVTMKTMAQYVALRLPVLTVFAAVDLDRNPKGYAYLANRVRKVAAEHKGKLLFNIANAADFAEPMAKVYGFEAVGQGADVQVGLADENMYYQMQKDAVFSADSLRAFVAAFARGELEGKEVRCCCCCCFSLG